MTGTDRLSRGVTTFLGARLLNTLANAALLFLLTRYLLEPGAYGLLYFAISVVGVATMFATLGLPKSTGRYVTEYLADDESQVPHVVRSALAYLLGLAAVVAVVIAVVHAPLADLLGNADVAPFLLVGAGYVLARALFEFLTSAFQGFNRVDYSALLSAINGVGRVAFAVGFILLGFGALGAFGGYVAGYALAAAVGLAVLYGRLLSGIETAAERAEGLTRRVLEYSVPTAATRVSVVLDSRVDKVLIGVLAGPVAVGFYTLAEQIATFCVVPAQSLGFTISPALGDQKADDRLDEAARLYERSFENVLLLYLPAAVGLFLVAEPAVRYVFGTDYLGAVPVLKLFSVFIVVRAIHKITGNALDYLGLARIRAIARGTTAVGNAVLNVLLIPPYGAVGAGVATVITYSIYTAINVYYIDAELGVRTSYVLGRAARVAVIALLMGAAVSVVMPVVDGVLTLAAAIALGVAVWGVLAVASGLLDPAEVRSFLA